MNLNDIDYLIAIAEHRHVGRSAGALGLTQSALTSAKSRLDVLAGIPLFERHPKGVLPTAAGGRAVTGRNLQFVNLPAPDHLTCLRAVGRGRKELAEPANSTGHFEAAPPVPGAS